MKFVPGDMTHDQVREVSALIHVENELIDDALGRVMTRIDERGWGGDTDVVFTTDHGELQGDFGLLFKGPYHVDALMRVPLVWRPAPSAGVTPGRGRRARRPCRPGAHLLRDRRGRRCPSGPRARPLPDAPGSDRQWAITEWDSAIPPHRHASALDLPRRLALHRV